VSDGGTKPKGMFGRLFGGKSADDSRAEAPRTDIPPGEKSEIEAREPDVQAAVETGEAASGAGFFDRLRKGLGKTSSKLSDGITGLFTKRKLTADSLEDLEDVLIESDLGLETSERIISTLAKGRYEKGIAAEDVRAVLKSEVERVLSPVAVPLSIDPSHKPHVILVVGVNGTGKTTTIGKLAAHLRREGKSVMLAAGDTFRAAAIDQLKIWAERTGCSIVARNVGSDATGLVYDALAGARAEGSDVLLIDTAGRLQNKEGLMDELAKVIRVLRKLDPTAPHEVLLVLDATTGQNALSQVDVFRARAGVTGLVMTKLDGTARGGILVAISAKHGLPVRAIGIGEGVDDLQPFDAGGFAQAIAAG
jgi:fused signal recognition particle receptor